VLVTAYAPDLAARASAGQAAGYFFAAAAAGTLLLVAVSYAVHYFFAPYRQRNEARQALDLAAARRRSPLVICLPAQYRRDLGLTKAIVLEVRNTSDIAVSSAYGKVISAKLVGSYNGESTYIDAPAPLQQSHLKWLGLHYPAITLPVGSPCYLIVAVTDPYMPRRYVGFGATHESGGGFQLTSGVLLLTVEVGSETQGFMPQEATLVVHWGTSGALEASLVSCGERDGTGYQESTAQDISHASGR